MPLILISGLPASGKTTRAQELCSYFRERNKQIHLVSENEAIVRAGFGKNDYFSDSQKEKQVRSDIKSEAIRLLNKDDVVIIDAGNYIKGYRYELFCATKAARSTQCTLFCGIQTERAWELNEKRKDVDVIIDDDTNTTSSKSTNDASSKSSSEVPNNSNVPYTREVFDALCMRFEEPHSNCRWDSPLFVTYPEEALDLSAIYAALYESKPPPPNQSTQNPPLSSTNYLFEMDRITQQIVRDTLGAQKIGLSGPLRVSGSQIDLIVKPNLTAIQLNRLRRQFINFSKTHHATTSSLDKVPQLFVQFVNANCID